ncbi:conserved hypothetical protein [Flavobacterium sp. 9AF]|uniref:hypothetical protein n=1 Tax=Flavobacterium sp. 9AF TaxID=2653142 RepID=UPI0012F15B2E|nr:hypothetical protein [Flavobacterium sp. 9AF]VXB67240.1 conserved hypothetical protein [Flavobacterium sp. 9AF]
MNARFDLNSYKLYIYHHYFFMKNGYLFIIFSTFLLNSAWLWSQSLASNNTKAQARYNLEKSFADTHRKTFAITSWAGANINELVEQWGNYSNSTELPNGLKVYTYEKRFSGSGGTYREGYTISDQYGNILEQQAAQDNTYSYNFVDYYEFYVDKNNIILHVKIGTR